MDKEYDKEDDSVQVALLRFILHEIITSGICESSAKNIIILQSHLKLLLQIRNSHKPIL